MSGAAAKTLVCLAWGESVLLCGLWITPFVCRHTLTDPRGIWRGNPDGQAEEGGCFYKDKYRRDPSCLAVLFQIGALLYYKEMNFFVTNGNILLHLLGKDSTLSLWQIVAPLGISYYTLSYIAYILDVYWGVVSPQRNFLKFCLFGIYFPIMISGPITRYQEIEQDLYAGNRVDYQGFCFGLQRILWGLFKKLVIADRMAPIVQEIWSESKCQKGKTSKNSSAG